MKFNISKPTKNKQFGDLVYTKPEADECEKAFSLFESKCRESAKKKFAYNGTIINRLEAELKMIKQTNSVFTFLIIEEIKELSENIGYPVSVKGEGSGLIVLNLLGVSNIHPVEYKFSETPTQLFLRKVDLNKGKVKLSVSVAKPVRKRVVSHLNNIFGFVRSSEKEKERISLPSWKVLEAIGELSNSTGFSYKEFGEGFPEYYSEVWKDIFYKEFENKSFQHYELETLLDLARHYAFTRCCINGEKAFLEYSDLRWNIFRDNVYEGLIKAGFDKNEAYSMSRLWSNSDKREKEIKRLEEHNTQANIIYVFRKLTNLWSEASCLSTVRILLILKEYEINYPFEYNEIKSAFLDSDNYYAI